MFLPAIYLIVLLSLISLTGVVIFVAKNSLEFKQMRGNLLFLFGGLVVTSYALIYAVWEIMALRSF